MQDIYKIPLATGLNFKTNKIFQKEKRKRTLAMIHQKDLLCLICSVSPPGPNPDCLRRPGRSARRTVAQEPEQSGESQCGGNERSGSPLLPG